MIVDCRIGLQISLSGGSYTELLKKRLELCLLWWVISTQTHVNHFAINNLAEDLGRDLMRQTPVLYSHVFITCVLY